MTGDSGPCRNGLEGLGQRGFHPDIRDQGNMHDWVLLAQQQGSGYDTMDHIRVVHSSAHTLLLPPPRCARKSKCVSAFHHDRRHQLEGCP